MTRSWVKRVDVPCLICGKTKKQCVGTLKKGYGKYCGRDCWVVSKKGRPPQPITKEIRKKLSIARKGNTNGFKKGDIAWNKGKKNWMEWTQERRMKNSYAHRGEKSYLWKGGRTKMAERIRRSMEYKFWREAVFKRDDFICQGCGERGGKLNADHIKPFAHFPELRFEISNGRTLCVPCHKKTDSYLNRGYIPSQEQMQNL